MKSPWMLVFASLLAPAGIAQQASSPWPEITQSAKPWTRWWWPGSAVEKSAAHRATRSHRRRRDRRRRDHAHLWRARRRGASPRFPVATLDRDARAHDARSRAPRAAASTWRRVRAGLSADPRSARAMARAASRSVDGKLAGKPTAMKVKRAGAGRRRPGARSLFRGRARSLPAPFSKAFAEFPRDAPRPRCPRAVPRFLRVLQLELDARDCRAYSGRCTATTSSRSPRALAGETAARRGHAGPRQGRLSAHARQAASRLRERVGEVVRTTKASWRATRRTARPATCSTSTASPIFPKPNRSG